ncbi:MAG: EAL domain-containing protein (putative c-di-GMP-specific phosphodiesterase class I) [Zhongshania aliphaticivorans]|jgi:EAL domain-containing protein (putative c-di-GMP-specific phosphodiesterase class I)
MTIADEKKQDLDILIQGTHTNYMYKHTDISHYMGDIISEAIREKHFYMVYQPQFALGSGKLLGFEALIRCQSPDFGLVSPADFIPFAEENGEIVEIGKWIFRQALLDLKTLRDKGLDDIYMSVNLSPAQFAAGDVFEQVMVLLMEFNLPPTALKLELTETALIRNAEVAARTFRAFQNEGVQIWLDDFGTGFASLNLLREFKIDGLKIDKSFIDGIHRNDDDFTICSAIIAMAQRLGLHVVAEGIEDEMQAQILGQLGCDAAQGFLLARPQAIAQCIESWVPKAT